MLTERDLRHFSACIIRRRGAIAPHAAALRAERYRAAGEVEAAETWSRIGRMIADLLRQAATQGGNPPRRACGPLQAEI